VGGDKERKWNNGWDGNGNGGRFVDFFERKLFVFERIIYFNGFYLKYFKHF
jgi:hypothetical protein